MCARRAHSLWKARRFLVPLNFSLNFYVSLKQPVLPENVPGSLWVFRSFLWRSQTPLSVHTHSAVGSLRGAAPGAASTGMAHGGYLEQPFRRRGGRRTRGGLTLIKVHQRVLKEIRAGESRTGSTGLSARPSCGRERRREISNLPQMEPLCPVTHARSAGS